MADAIVRLRVESSEYDQKLSRATQQLQYMEKEVRRTGATFAYADKEELEFIKSIGSMQTKADSAKGKIAEMTKSFTELSLQYNRLTKEEKNSPFGKAMADSIGQIKGRIGDLGGQLNDVGAELKTTGGFIDTLADGLGQLGPVGQMAGKLLKGAFGPVGIAIAAVVGIIQQLVEAFKRNEDAMASASRAAAPFKAIWQQIERAFDKLVPLIATGMEKIADIFQSIVNKITGWIGDLGQTWIGKKLGLDDAYESLKKFREEQAKLTEDNKKIADSENALNKMRRSTETGNTQRRAQISELRFKASDKTNYSAEERVGFLEKAQDLEGKTLQANLALRQKEYELIKLKNSLTKSGTEDLNAENAALNAITDARTEYNEHLRSTQRQLEDARKEMEKEVQAAEKASSAEPQELNPTMPGPSMSAFEKMQQGIRIRLAEQNFDVDQTSLTNLMTVAIQNGIDGMDGAFENLQYQLAEGMNIPDSAWQTLVDTINEKLADLGLEPIVLNADTGAVTELEQKLEELPTKFDLVKESISQMESGVSAISTIGNAFNELKGIGEDLEKAFSGEMDAWDALMTVFNSGIGIMQTVIGVMEAINTLQELGNALSDAKVAKQAAETTAVVSGKGAEAAAETAEAAASGTATAANTAEAASGAGAAMAGIPIVGPVLAVAAIAAVLAAVLAATSKSKSAGKFANGGIVPGNSFSGDNLRTSDFGIDSGELILNRAQQGSIANQLQGAAQQSVVVEGRISGKDILLSANNTNRAAGGSRGYYTKVK